MTKHNKIITKLNNTEILANLLWTAFGIVGGFKYYSKAEYLTCGLLFLIGLLYAYKLTKSIVRK